MSDPLLTTLLPARDIAAFERRPDGTFALVARSPHWFGRLIADETFPFLGHILEEAVQFWNSGQPGRRDWGPCADVDESNREFHYKVTAVTAGDAQYLLFQLDPGSDEMREVLQRVRANALAAEYQSSVEGETLLAVQREVRRAATEIEDLLARFLRAPSRWLPNELAKDLAQKCGRLADGVDVLVGSARSAGHR